MIRISKRKIQTLADLAMTVMLPFLMAYNMIGDAAHEWVGTAMLAMFILHHVLNFRFITSLNKGQYTPNRILLTVMDFLLLADMLALMISGVMLSRHVFSFLGITSGIALARTMHLLASYWGFVLMSIHIGLHFHTAIGKMQKLFSKRVKALTILSRVLCAVISAYGLYAFLSRNLIDYMLLSIQFVFFDFSEPILLFVLNYAAMIVLFAAVGYYASKLIRMGGKKRKKNGGTV